MRAHQRGSALIITVIVVLIIAVIGVGLLRFTSREVAGATAGLRAEALSSSADAARRLLESRFHVLGVTPADITVLNQRMDGPAGRYAAVGGHVDADPTQAVATIMQVEAVPGAIKAEYGSSDITNGLNWLGGQRAGGVPLKVVVHCQEGDLSSPTSGRQLEIEYGVRFGL
jgi:Tfp pilus assembly protein PilX